MQKHNSTSYISRHTVLYYSYQNGRIAIGEFSFGEVYVYDGNGNTARCTVVDASGNALAEYRYEYDSLGRLIRSTQLDGDSTLLRTEHLYDADNRLTKQSYQIGDRSFSESYAYNRTAVIVSGDNTDIASMEDLEGKRTANTISSTYAEVAEGYGAEVTGVDDLNQTFELLLSGRIDATLNAEVTYYDYMEAHPDANIKIACLDPEATQVAIPFRKGEETASLREAVNQALADMRESGALSELSEKYFGTDITQPA